MVFSNVKVKTFIPLQSVLRQILLPNVNEQFKNYPLYNNQYYNVSLEIMTMNVISWFLVQYREESLSTESIINRFNKGLKYIISNTESLIISNLNGIEKMYITNLKIEPSLVYFKLYLSFKEQLILIWKSYNYNVTDNIILTDTFTSAAVEKILEVFFIENINIIQTFLSKQQELPLNEIYNIIELQYKELFYSKLGELGSQVEIVRKRISKNYNELNNNSSSKNSRSVYRECQIVSISNRRVFLSLGLELWKDGINDINHQAASAKVKFFSNAKFDNSLLWLYEQQVTYFLEKEKPIVDYEDWLELLINDALKKKGDIQNKELLKIEEQNFLEIDKCKCGSTMGICNICPTCTCCCNCQYGCTWCICNTGCQCGSTTPGVCKKCECTGCTGNCQVCNTAFGACATLGSCCYFTSDNEKCTSQNNGGGSSATPFGDCQTYCMCNS